MSIGKRVEEAVAKMDLGDAEGALFQISSALDATAKDESAKGGAKSYKEFIHENLGLITDIAFHGKQILNLHIAFDHPDIKKDATGTCTVQDILYHAVRCGLYHEAKLPSNLRFTNEGQIRVDAGSLILPSALIYGLIGAVVLAPGNREERVSGPTIMDLGGFPLLLNSLWGRRHEFVWLLDARRATMQMIQKLKLAGDHAA